jgi:hypothetical protein
MRAAGAPGKMRARFEGGFEPEEKVMLRGGSIKVRMIPVVACIGVSLAGADPAGAFEQVQRVNSLTMQAGTDSYATANRFGGAFTGDTVRSQLQNALTSSVADGSTTWLLRMPDLADLSGTSDPAFTIGVTDGTPNSPAGNTATYSGSSDLDWWYDPTGSTNQLTASFSAKTLNSGPVLLDLTTTLAGQPANLSMSSAKIRAVSGSSSTPLKSTNGYPPGHLPNENLADSMTSFQSMSSGQLAGNISTRSLANTPIPPSFAGTGFTNCSRGYSISNSVLDLLVGGCTILGAPQVSASQPDQSVAGNGDVYVFTTDSTTKAVNGCTRNGTAASLDGCLDGAAYSSYFQFTTDRVIVLPVTPERLPETTINSGPADGSTTTSPTATFGFTSDTGSTFQCSVDGSAFGACSGGSSHTTASLTDGAHTFQVRAVDSVARVDPTPASRTFTVDTPATEGGGGGGGETGPTETGPTETGPTETGPTDDGSGDSKDIAPPETTITKGPANKTAKRKVKFLFTASEPGSTFQCKIDKAPFAPCASPAKFKVRAGKHTFQVAATDAAGNTDQTPAKDKFKIVG